MPKDKTEKTKKSRANFITRMINKYTTLGKAAHKAEKAMEGANRKRRNKN